MFGLHQRLIVDAIKQIAMQIVREKDMDDVVGAGVAVERFIGDFRKNYADLVPAIPPNPGRGLLSHNEAISVGDFELAQHLLNSEHADMIELSARFSGTPVLIAYLCVALSRRSHTLYSGLEEALRYVIGMSSVATASLEESIRRLEPEAKHGRSFKEGRKPGTLSLVAKAIIKYLKAHPAASPIEVWTALKARPPKGHHFMDNRLGKYIERDAGKDMKWRRFSNLVSEHRPKE